MKPPNAVCGTCDFFIKTGVDPATLKPAYICRRYPKTVSMQLVETPSGPQIALQQGNPTETAQSPACGEWHLRTQEAANHGNRAA